jgi:hypothetical protein
MLKHFVLGTAGLLISFALNGAALADSAGGGDRPNPYCQPFHGQGCYWMENQSGFYCWVPATWSPSFAQCYQNDSCYSDHAYPGGGCYKWADCSDCDRYLWTPIEQPIGNQPIGGGVPEEQKPGSASTNPVPAP